LIISFLIGLPILGAPCIRRYDARGPARASQVSSGIVEGLNLKIKLSTRKAFG
jgi:transposase